MSGALTSTLLGLAASNLRLIPFETPSYGFFMEFLLPHTIPLLLFRADLRRIIRSTGSLLLAFLIGSGKDLVFCLKASFWIGISLDSCLRLTKVYVFEWF